MAVFTPVDRASAQALASRLGVGTVQSLEPVVAGIENTNYYVDTDGGRWVLTLFERIDGAALDFCLRLMRHLSARELPIPGPLADANGVFLHAVAGKPAALVPRLPGRHLSAPDLHHCAQLGAVLARMHRVVVDFEPRQPSPRPLAWWEATAPRVAPFLDEGQRALLADELDFQRQLAASAAYAALPRGAVHTDLFRDNVLFDGLAGHERLTGCLDFFFAGVDAFAYDLAVCLNDWCLDDDGSRLDEARTAALLAAYARERALPAAEARLLPALLRAAALRFWLSRLADLHLPRDAALIAPKDPSHFERVLRRHREAPFHPSV